MTTHSLSSLSKVGRCSRVTQLLMVESLSICDHFVLTVTNRSLWVTSVSFLYDVYLNKVVRLGEANVEYDNIMLTTAYGINS